MTKKELEEIFLEAKKVGLDVCVEITIPGQKDTEYIINKNESIINKLEYYNDVYTSELVHKRNPLIRIVNACIIDFYMGDN